MGKTSIEWTDATWNPVRGCSRVSQGCVNCYAERVASRFAKAGEPFHQFATKVNGHPAWTGKVELVEKHLEDPLHWKQPKRVFVNSMSDLFHEDLPDEAIDRVFAVMALCPRHTFQILTKRPERMLTYLGFMCDSGVYPKTHAVGRIMASMNRDHRVGAAALRWPLPNVWMGVSVEDQATADERVPLLLQTPAAVRFVSYEPALGPVDFDKWSTVGGGEWRHCIDWLIIGGESGPSARPFEINWARNALMQFTGTGNSVFVKQLGAHPIVSSCKKIPAETAKEWASRERNFFKEWPETTHFGNRTGIAEFNGYEALIQDRKGGDWSEWPEDLRVREFPEVSG